MSKPKNAITKDAIKYLLGIAMLTALIAVWSCAEETASPSPEPNFTVNEAGYYVTELKNGAVRGEIDKELLNQLFEYKEGEYGSPDEVRPPEQLLIDVGLTPDEDVLRNDYYKDNWYVEVRRFVPKYQENLPSEFQNIVVYAKPEAPLYTYHKHRDRYQHGDSVIVADEDNPFRTSGHLLSDYHFDDVDKDNANGAVQFNAEVFWRDEDAHSQQNCAASVDDIDIDIDDYLPDSVGCFFSLHATRNNILQESYIKKHINRNERPETIEVVSKDGRSIEFEEESDFTMLVPYGYDVDPESEIFEDLIDLP